MLSALLDVGTISTLSTVLPPVFIASALAKPE